MSEQTQTKKTGFFSRVKAEFKKIIWPTKKDVAKQMLANPKVEIACAKPDGHWLRYTGKVVFETDPKYAEMNLEAMPMLRDIYNDETGHKLMMFHLEDATAVDIPMMGPGENLL